MAAKSKKNNSDKILLILMIFIITGLAASGYYLLVKKILPEIRSEKAAAEGPEDAVRAASILKASKDTQGEEYIPDGESEAMRLYFPLKGSDKLVSDLRRVRKSDKLTVKAESIVNGILSGTIKPSLYNVLPEKTQLRALYFDAGKFIVDFSSDFLDLRKLGPSEEILGVYSIVNALTELNSKAGVKLLINGSEPSSEGGCVDLSQPLFRLESIIE